MNPSVQTSNGFELIRQLTLEYSIRTRNEALTFRTALANKTFALSASETSPSSGVTDTIRRIDYEAARFAIRPLCNFRNWRIPYPLFTFRKNIIVANLLLAIHLRATEKLYPEQHSMYRWNSLSENLPGIPAASYCSLAVGILPLCQGDHNTSLSKASPSVTGRV